MSVGCDLLGRLHNKLFLIKTPMLELRTEIYAIITAQQLKKIKVQGKAVIHKLNTSDRLHIYTLQRLSWEMVA